MSLKPFENEQLLDFQSADNEAQFTAALAKVKGELGREYQLVIGGESVASSETFTSINPSKTSEVIGRFARGQVEHVDQAFDAAWTAFESWSKTSAAERCDLLVRVAGLIRDRKMELSAWMTLEVGKSRVEADADVAEAIDFCEFYAREALRYAEPQPLTPFPGEENELLWIPIGVGVVIPPWNFPFAILVGMTAAALVTGNTVVLKPSSDAPTIAMKFMELLTDAGMPGGVVNFLPGPGASIGDDLVDSPRTRFVAFTGSKEVGLRINERAAKPQDGQLWIKRVIAEMGGKDGIIVDGDVDLQAAVTNVVSSAFGFSGQKCSACSRVMVDASVYDEFVAELKPLVENLVTGPTENKETYIGPLVNQGALTKTLDYIEIGRGEGELLVGGEKGSDDGFFVKPTVFIGVSRDSRLAREEIFGPVLAVIKVDDFDEALAVANDTDYGLTGAVFTNDREKIDRARREFHVGNLYFNRKCTGALVGVHPFGGFNMSGTDSKAGGRDYLALFMQLKLVSEKVK